MTPKEEADNLYRFSKSTILYFIKNISDEDLHLLSKQISLTQIKYTSDRINDKSTSLDILKIREEIEKL